MIWEYSLNWQFSVECFVKVQFVQMCKMKVYTSPRFQRKNSLCISVRQLENCQFDELYCLRCDVDKDFQIDQWLLERIINQVINLINGSQHEVLLNSHCGHMIRCEKSGHLQEAVRSQEHTVSLFCVREIAITGFSRLTPWHMQPHSLSDVNW